MTQGAADDCKFVFLETRSESQRCRLLSNPHVWSRGVATLCTRGFSSLVAFTAALIATGWSEPVPGRAYSRCGPTPFTAHPVIRLPRPCDRRQAGPKITSVLPTNQKLRTPMAFSLCFVRPISKTVVSRRVRSLWAPCSICLRFTAGSQRR